MIKEIKEIEIKNFRIHEKTKIENIDSFLTLVGKNNVGKSSVLLALQKLFNPKAKISRKDKNDVSLPVTISAKMDDGSIIDFASRDSQSINYFYFPAGKQLEGSWKQKTVAELIKDHKNNTQYFKLCELKNQINEIIDLFTYINDLSPLLDQHPKWKKAFGDFIEGKELNSYHYKDIHKLLAIKDDIYNHLSKRTIDMQYEPIINNIYDIINKFKVGYDEMDFRYADENTQGAISEFIENGDSTYILEHNEVSGNADYYERYEEYDSSWFDDFKKEINDAYFHGCNKISVIDDAFLKNYGYYDLFLYYPAKEIDEKASDIRKDLDEYIKRKTDNEIVDLWATLLLDIAKNNSIPISNQGSGIQRLCAIFVNSVKCYRDDSLYNIPTVFAIDEIEISLHPNQQRVIVNILKELSKHFQIIITTHSPIIVKEMGANINSIKVLTQNGVENLTNNRKKCIVHYDSANKDDGYVSINEINYIAFDEPSIEYHIELFGYMQERSTYERISDVDTWLEHKTVDASLRFDDNGTDDGFVDTSNQLVKKIGCWTRVGGTNDGRHENSTLPVCVRNNIDHPDSRNNYFNDKVERSIKLMRSVIENDTTTFPIPRP